MRQNAKTVFQAFWQDAFSSIKRFLHRKMEKNLILFLLKNKFERKLKELPKDVLIK